MPKSLSRKDNHRRSLLRNLATSLVLYEEIRTTRAKAKEVKSIVERLINLAKKNDLGAHRRLLGYFYDENASQKVFEVLVPRYKSIPSGFVKIYHLGPRLGDAAEMALLKFVPGEKPKEIKIEDKAIKDKNAKKVERKAKKQESEKNRNSKVKK